MNLWSGFQVDPDVLVGKRGERRLKGLIPQNLRNCRRVKDRCVAGIQDGNTAADLHSGRIVLRSSKLQLLEAGDTGIIIRKIYRDAGKDGRKPGIAAAEAGESSLAQDGILLRLQLCEQSGNRLRSRLVDGAAGDKLIDQVLRSRVGGQGSQDRRHMEDLNTGRELHAEVAHHGLINLERLKIEHHLRRTLIEVLDECGSGIEERFWCADGNGLFTRLRQQESNLEQAAQQ